MPFPEVSKADMICLHFYFLISGWHLVLSRRGKIKDKYCAKQAVLRLNGCETVILLEIV